MRLFAASIATAAVSLLAVWAAGPEPAQTAFPGQNGLIVFRSDRTDDAELWTMNPDGSNQVDVTNTDGFDHDPAWNAAGTRIAYFLCADRESCEIYTMNADGSDKTRITDNDEEDYDPTWSPDGKRLAISQEEDPDIYVMNSDGSGFADITNNPAFDGDPAWSPLGDTIAFDSTRDGNLEIYTISPDGSNPVNLTQTPSIGENNPAWSPDGSLIAYTDQNNGDIWAMNADGSGKTRLTFDDAWDDDPAWSPDGMFIAFTSFRDDEDGDVYVMPFKGIAATGAEVVTRLTTTPGFDGVPDWGPLAATPTPQPTPSGTAGDADCDDDVDSVDALLDLRFVAGFPPAQCIEDGNVKCDDPVDSVDALFILRHVAALPVNIPDGCRQIGT